QRELLPRLDDNLAILKSLYERCSDFVLREFEYGRQEVTRGAVLYFDGLIAKPEVEQTIIKPLVSELNMMGEKGHQPSLSFDQIKTGLLSSGELKELTTFDEVCLHISSGDTVVLFDHSSKALMAGTRSWMGRGVNIPPNEGVIHGPKEGFCETLRFNTALLRRRIRSTNLKMEAFQIGRISRTDVVITYIEGKVKPELVAEVLRRLKAIEIDSVVDAAYIEELIEDQQLTLFPQVMVTERPDRVMGNLMEGRVAIIIDGTPTVMIVPVTLSMFMTVGEDYYMRFTAAGFFRILRFLAFTLSLLAPALYVSTITFHQEMVPTALLVTIVNARQAVPFPLVVEALLMELSFELLREAGVRLPQAVGPAVSIVGALVLGDAGVRAGLVSTPMVVVVAFTGICSFVIPVYSMATAIRLIRFPLLILGSMLGYFGIALGIITLLIHLAALESFGIPYSMPFAPLQLSSWSDTLIRRPWRTAAHRRGLMGAASNAPTLQGKGGDTQ
ncbi:MAG: spore germination protein, partial [Methanomassiliicoccales archaeon]